jgi:hypothetical protein
MKDSTFKQHLPTIFRIIWLLNTSSKNAVYFLQEEQMQKNNEDLSESEEIKDEERINQNGIIEIDDI